MTIQAQHGQPRHRGGIVTAAIVAVVVVAVVLALATVWILGARLFGSSDRHVTIADERIAVQLTVPKRLGITNVSTRQDGECGHAGYYFAGELSFEMYSTTCEDLSDIEPLNGSHPVYRNLEEADGFDDVEDIATQLGPARIFTQQYTECTNFCRTFDEPVAIIELDAPIDPQFRSIMMLGSRGKVSRAELAEIVTTLQVPR